MNDINKWWKAWAPVWEHMEERHMGTETIKQIYSNISGPVLIIGAGQGVLMKYLIDNDFIVDGIDLDDEMIKNAKKRHGIKIIKADAGKLPFKNNSYKTVIISSGVVDYITDEKLIKKIINEAFRVTGINGNLFIAFYLQNEALEKIYKKIGVITKDNKILQKRMFLVEKLVNNSLFKLGPVPLIMEWTNKNFFSVFLFWTKIGLTRPKALFDERDRMNCIFENAKKINIDVEALIDYIPDEVPYRDFNAIKNLFNNLNIKYNSLNRYYECAIASIHKSALYDFNSAKDDSKKKGLIQTFNLCKKYKDSNDNAVENLNLNIQKGTIFGLLGPNGAGKTTTLSMLTGLIKPTAGEIIFGDNIKVKDIKKIIGYVPQDLALYQKLTAVENLEFFGSLHNIKNTELKLRIDNLLNLVGLNSRRNELVKNYSTGMMRRLNLAVGLINNPKLILMDEPTVGIDPQSRNCIYEAVLNLKNNDITILYTTHYMDEATKLCDTVAIMDHGKILVEGSPKELIRKHGFSKIRFNINSKHDKKYYESLQKIKDIYDIKLNKNNMEILINNQKDSIKIIEKIEAAAKKSKVKIKLINMVEPTLESLFLDITGKHLRDFAEEVTN